MLLHPARDPQRRCYALRPAWQPTPTGIADARERLPFCFERLRLDYLSRRDMLLERFAGPLRVFGLRFREPTSINVISL
jgi:hypothetical protein